jgi:hypothetical protein
MEKNNIGSRNLPVPAHDVSKMKLHTGTGIYGDIFAGKIPQKSKLIGMTGC